MKEKEQSLLDEAMELCEATFRQATGTDLKLAEKIIDLKKRVIESHKGNTDSQPRSKEEIGEKPIKKETPKEKAFGEDISEPLI